MARTRQPRKAAQESRTADKTRRARRVGVFVRLSLASAPAEAVLKRSPLSHRADGALGWLQLQAIQLGSL